MSAATATVLPVHLMTNSQLQAEADALARRIACGKCTTADSSTVIELANRLIRAQRPATAAEYTAQFLATEFKHEPTSAGGFSPGDWVVSSEFQRVAKVQQAYQDSNGSGVLLDLVFYNRDGKRIGRESPAMGGPKKYEPACAAEHWLHIERPDFDILPTYGSLEGRVITKGQQA